MYSTSDFEKIQWHDNAIHGLRILEGETSGELVLDIDFITDWLPPTKGAMVSGLRHQILCFTKSQISLFQSTMRLLAQPYNL